MQSNLPGETGHPADPSPLEPSVLWTLGHSTRPLDEFLGLLQAFDIQLLADVRTTPYSRRNPQFHSSALAKSLAGAAIAYRHMPKLGGRRKSRRDSANAGWRNESFRGYADYMETQAFWDGLEDLMAMGHKQSVAIMCAEAVPWRCHRTLIADALVSRGWTVRHIISSSSLKAHACTPFARLQGNRLIYPAEGPQDSKLTLF